VAWDCGWPTGWCWEYDWFVGSWGSDCNGSGVCDCTCCSGNTWTWTWGGCEGSCSWPWVWDWCCTTGWSACWDALTLRCWEELVTDDVGGSCDTPTLEFVVVWWLDDVWLDATGWAVCWFCIKISSLSRRKSSPFTTASQSKQTTQHMSWFQISIEGLMEHVLVP